MSKRKGVTLDEKRSRLLQIFYEKREFFTLKELEKIAPKEKGIVVQSVKDVLQNLVDDGLVHSDKIGTSIYFWAFPGEKITSLENRIAEAKRKIVEAEFKIRKLNEEIEKEKAGKEDSEEKQILLKEIEELKRSEADLLGLIDKFKDIDPAEIAKLAEQSELYKDAANTWTDNIYAIQSWCKNKFDIEREFLNKQFNIPDELEYLD
ncbi:meiotic nuclear division protein 1 homolog [Leptopilina boulardi]|uniref:meiotic nuclear division protein 1 homolog n=1 Tax=Leptopilina boulardi TaxID=63433 RepID=UPI0021F65CCE|nr:meiotic nuclear division protein 1 homolog [Leptopilina boulardi]